MRTLEFVAPANMENLGQLRSWPLGEPLAADHVDVHIDLRRWRRVTPNPVVGLIAVAAYHARQDHRIRITYPDADYARRMLGTVGFLEALQTFATWTDAAGSVGKVERILPIIPVHNFRTSPDVENLTSVMDEEFAASDRLPASLLQDASLALAESADNVIWHAGCEEGGFALAQVRRRRVFDTTRWFIEVAVADPGCGIRASLGVTDDDWLAVAAAMEEGRSGLTDEYRGYGLTHMVEAAGKPGRLLTVHFGNGFVVRGHDYVLQRTVDARFPGTLVTMSIPASDPV